MLRRIPECAADSVVERLKAVPSSALASKQYSSCRSPVYATEARSVGLVRGPNINALDHALVSAFAVGSLGGALLVGAFGWRWPLGRSIAVATLAEAMLASAGYDRLTR